MSYPIYSPTLRRFTAHDTYLKNKYKTVRQENEVSIQSSSCSLLFFREVTIMSKDCFTVLIRINHWKVKLCAILWRKIFSKGNGKGKYMHGIQVDIQRGFNVDTTLCDVARRRIDVETTSCVNWDGVNP